MKISKTHQEFSERLNQPDALTEPEKYLGFNYQDVLNFWIYVDTLSDKEKREMFYRYCVLDDKVRDFAWFAARDAATEVVDREFSDAAWCAAWNVTGLRVFARVTVELIGSHKLLEQNKILTFLPLCIRP